MTLPEAEALYARVREHAGVVKVGLSLFVEHGPAAVKAFTSRGAKVFLDLKLHDIPNTVELAAQKAGALGVAYLTVHAAGGAAMVRAAVKGAALGAKSAGHEAPNILAVTVLTSMDDAALASTGVTGALELQVEKLAKLSVGAGASGLVCSVREAARLRALLGSDVVLCTPGVRPAGAAAGDQARAESPTQAVAAGSNLLVIGRPIYGAEDPLAAAKAIALEVKSAHDALS